MAFTGSSHRIGDPNNGNVLGLIELLLRTDHMLLEHVQNVMEYQENMNAFKFIIYLRSP